MIDDDDIQRAVEVRGRVVAAMGFVHDEAAPDRACDAANALTVGLLVADALAELGDELRHG